MRTLLATLALLFFASPALAQQPPVAGPNSHLAFDVDAPDLSTAMLWLYELELDAEVLGNTPTVCLGATSPFDCHVALPPMTPALHTIRVRIQGDFSGTNIVSDWSPPFQFRMVILAPPRNVRTEPGPVPDPE
jgi:hypothetical protein